MQFRRATTLLLTVLTLLFSWSALCTWKKFQLEKEVQHRIFSEGENINYREIAEELNREYGKGKPVWTIPIIGFEITYDHIRNHALSQGQDIIGGNDMVIVIDEVTLIENMSKNSSKFKLVFKEAQEKWGGDQKKSFIDYFVDAVEAKKQGSLSSYLIKSEEIKGDNATIRAALHNKVKKLTKDAVEKIKKRVDPNSNKGYEVYIRTHGGLVIKHPIQAKNNALNRLVESQGLLQFVEVADKETSDKFIENLKEQLKKDGTATEDYIHLIRGTYCCEVKNAKKIKEAIKEISNKQIRCYLHSKKTQMYQNDSTEYREVIVVHCDQKYNTKEGFSVSKANRNVDPKGGFQISITLESESAKLFGELTQTIITKHNGEGRMAIILDDKAIMAPRVESKLEDSFSITGNFNLEDANTTILQLRTGALPKFRIVERNYTGPTLGEESRSQGISAILLGLLLILLFMALYYALAGMVANCVLLFNLLFIAGTLAQFHSALTLAGIAGVVLTIGMAIDINVIFFEAIRNALGVGLPIKKAIQTAYDKSYRSIIDSNVTTLLAGIILYSLGVGPIKGFAFTLIIGIVCSLLTGLLLSKLMLDLLASYNIIKPSSFSFSFTSNLFTNFNIDFLGKRKLAYLLSVIFIVSGFAINYHQGISYSTEFTGGQEYVLRFGKPIKKEVLEAAITKKFNQIIKEKKELNLKPGTTKVYQYGKKTNMKIVTNFGIDTAKLTVIDLIKESIEEEELYSFVSSTDKKTTDLSEEEFTVDSTVEIGSVVASSVKKSSILGILLALLAMLLYIFFTFNNFSLALGALIALIHDGCILFASIGFMKMCFHTNYPIGLTFITSLLTVIGYSINDTVVIAGFVIKEMKAKHTNNIGQVANRAINLTLSRTIITSLTTFIPVFILHLLGGPALQELSFSLLCGIICGTHSSIFIAIPLANDIANGWHYFKKKRKKTNPKTS